MSDQQVDSDLWVESCLDTLGIEQLCQWDVLNFLHRHQTSLAGSEQIARFLGYQIGAVTDALNFLDQAGLSRRSRASQGVRMYEFRRPEESPIAEAFDRLMALSDNRDVRLLLVEILRRDEQRPRITRPRPDGGGKPWLRVN